MAVYERPGVKTVRESELGHPILTGVGLTVGIVGKSEGKKTEVENSVSVRGVGDVDDIMTKDIPPKIATDVSKILRISDTLGGLAYHQGVGKDYILQNNKIVWNKDSFLRPVYMLPPVLRDTGGSFVPGTYFWVMTAYNGNGETIQSNEVKATVTATTSVQLRWEPVERAVGYKIFRSMLSGNYVDTLLVDIVGGDVSAYVDVGAAVGVGSPASVNTALRRPVTATQYYVDYIYQVYSYDPKQYFSLERVYVDHGMNSPLGIAARLAMGIPPQGNAAASVWLVAAESETVGSYVVALSKFERYRVDLIVSLLPIDVQALSYVVHQSKPENKNECILYTGPYAETPLGDASTPNTIIYNARALDNRRSVYVDNWAYVEIKNEDGTFERRKVDGTYLAAALAGLRSGIRDSAEPLTNKQLYGFVGLGTERLESEMDTAAAQGVCVIWSDRGRIMVRHCITTSIATIEDQEENIVVAEDDLRRSLRAAVNQPGRFIGRKLTPDMLNAIGEVTRMVLEGKVTEALISAFQNLQVEQDALEKRRVNVTFEYVPMYGITWIVFKYSFVV